MSVRVFVGVDLIRVSRIQRMIELGGEAVLTTVWRPSEIEYCVNRYDRLATRWAAKEATAKALGCGFGRIDPAHIEIVSRAGAAPELRLRKSARRRAGELGVTSTSVSLSHDGDLAIAYVSMFAEG